MLFRDIFFLSVLGCLVMTGAQEEHSRQQSLWSFESSSWWCTNYNNDGDDDTSRGGVGKEQRYYDFEGVHQAHEYDTNKRLSELRRRFQQRQREKVMHIQKQQEAKKKLREAQEAMNQEKLKQRAAAAAAAAEEAKKQKKEDEEKAKRNQKKANEATEKETCPYTVLGIDQDATQAEVKKAYRALTLKYHPDKNPGCDEMCQLKFTKLVDAYEILGDEDRRVLYDESDTFGAYQSRPHNYNSKAGFYSGTSSLVTPINATEFDRLVLCQGLTRKKSNSNSTAGDGSAAKEEGDEECVPWMVEFYTPWCVHCKNMIADWKRTASTMAGTETPLGFVRFAGVNCEMDKTLCQRLGVTSYPDIFLFVRDANGQEHVEKFGSTTPRTVDHFVQHAERGIRLAYESKLRPIDAFVMHKNVTNSESKGLWLVLFEGDRCGTACGTWKASLRRMSANLGTVTTSSESSSSSSALANFGILDCRKEPTVCAEQYIGSRFPVLKLYPYQGSKGTGETLMQAGSVADPNLVLPIVEKVIRMCLANIEAENGLMNMLHEEFEAPPEEPQQPQYHQYPEPERVVRRVLPGGVKAGGGARYLSGG